MADKNPNPHEYLSPEWYAWTHNQHESMHGKFCRWVNEQVGIKSVVEVGCGKHDFYHSTFTGAEYLGLDKSPDAITYCQQHHVSLPGHKWRCVNIPSEEAGDMKADLVFSHAAIDHSPNPDAFVEGCIGMAQKWVYIRNYRGYFAALPQHNIKRSENPFDADVYVDVSVPQVQALLRRLQAREAIAHFQLLSVPTGRPASEIDTELHIVVMI